MISVSCKSAKPATALIVDDSPTMREMLKAILTADGINVIGQLPSGKQLLQSIARLSPDIVCLDYNLPDSNGIDLLKSITSEHPHVAVVIITGETNPNLQNTAAEFGAAGFIHKPFSQDRITKELRQIIQTQHLLADVNKSSATSNAGVANVTSTAIVADDSKTIRALLVAILTSNGIRVVGEATNGFQAVEMVAQLKPDIICLDVVMPVMDGMEALKQIRKMNPATKVVMITANSSRDIVVEAFKEGAAGFIVKPLVEEKVVAAVALALRT